MLPFIITPASAHTGRTDSNGGHIDSGSGEYHYHHGYTAHAHYDMDGNGTIDCPYDFDDQTNYSSGSSPSGSSGSRPNSDPYTNGYKDGYERGKEAGCKSGQEAAQETNEKRLTSIKWIAFSILVVVVFLLIFVFRKILKIKKDDWDRIHSQQIRDLKSEHNAEMRKISAEKTVLSSQHAKEVNKLLSEKNALELRLTEKQRKIEAASNAEILLLKSRLKIQARNSALLEIISGNDETITIPSDIHFKQSFTPIKGKVRPCYRFGDYTVFVADGRKKYHCSHKCVQGAKPLHFFDLPLGLDPCQRCVPKDMYPQPLPDWYYQIREKLDSQF